MLSAWTGGHTLKSFSHKHPDDSGYSGYSGGSGGSRRTKRLLFHRYVDESRNPLPCLFKNKPIAQTGGKVACWSVPKANIADYPLGLLINLLTAILRITFGLFVFFSFNAHFPFTVPWAELPYNLFVHPGK